MKNKIFPILVTTLFITALVLLMLTVSIGLPIYCRFFYYMQIEPLNIPKTSGFSVEKISAAFADVMNYLTLPWHEFGTGELKYSADGAAHFADCKFLFNLNLFVMVISFGVLVWIGVFVRRKIVRLCRPFGHSSVLIAAAIAIVLPLTLGLIIAIDFDKAFTVFHTLFFPGKENWVFDPKKDEIIKILPEQFFMNCAIFIGVGLLIFALALVAYDLISIKVKHMRERKAEELKNMPQPTHKLV